jgi:flavin reductase (DIM6/NTAB) family NADH-FMN oxidoreductase RutF
MQELNKNNLISLDPEGKIWDQFFTVSPLVVVGTKENSGYDLAPKHMAMPLGQGNYFGFICTPDHATYHNVIRTGEFAVSFPYPDDVVLTSLAATPRCGDNIDKKTLVSALPILPTLRIDAIFIENSYLFLECELFRIIDGFGDYSLISGKLVACYIDEKSKRSEDIDDQEMIFNTPLLAYLAYGRFASIKETVAFPFPKDFEPLLP